MEHSGVSHISGSLRHKKYSESPEVVVLETLKLCCFLKLENRPLTDALGLPMLPTVFMRFGSAK